MLDRQYHDAISSARDIGLMMTRRQLAELVSMLQRYADELAASVSSRFATRGESHALELAREIISQMTIDMAASIGDTVRLTAEQVARIHADATALLAGENAVEADAHKKIAAAAVLAVVTRPALAGSLRSIRANSMASVTQILRRVTVRGNRNGLGSELALHVAGGSSLPDRLLLADGRVGYAAARALGYEATAENLSAVRKSAGQVMTRAELLARTEPMNAEHEAATRSAIESPVVKALRWRVSDYHTVTDVCDVLQDVDWYGLGPGLYDPRRVPKRPHPRCACSITHVLRDAADFGGRRGQVPTRIIHPSDVAFSYGFSPSQGEQLASVFREFSDASRSAA